MKVINLLLQGRYDQVLQPVKYTMVQRYPRRRRLSIPSTSLDSSCKLVVHYVCQIILLILISRFALLIEMEETWASMYGGSSLSKTT